MILDSLLTGMILFSSFAMRTPNVQPNPDDYELSIAVSHSSFYANRQWERELGTKYLDDNIWLLFDDGIYFKPEYMNKQSKELKYLKMDWRHKWSDFSYGLTTRSTKDDLTEYETFFSCGYKKIKKYGKVTIEVAFDGYLPPNDNNEIAPSLSTSIGDLEYEDKFKVSWKVNEKINIYNIGEIYNIKNKEFYKAKVGVEFQL